MKQEVNYMYRVLVVRQDLQIPLYVYESDSLESVEKCYRELDKEWTTSVEEKRPFRLRSPFITSFSPALCMEIKVEKLTFEDFQHEQNSNHTAMNEQGFTGFMNSNFNR